MSIYYCLYIYTRIKNDQCRFEYWKSQKYQNLASPRYVAKSVKPNFQYPGLSATSISNCINIGPAVWRIYKHSQSVCIYYIYYVCIYFHSCYRIHRCYTFTNLVLQNLFKITIIDALTFINTKLFSSTVNYCW